MYLKKNIDLILGLIFHLLYSREKQSFPRILCSPVKTEHSLIASIGNKRVGSSQLLELLNISKRDLRHEGRCFASLKHTRMAQSYQERQSQQTGPLQGHTMQCSEKMQKIVVTINIYSTIGK